MLRNQTTLNCFKHIGLLLLIFHFLGIVIKPQKGKQNVRNNEYQQLRKEWGYHRDNINFAKKLYAYRAKYGGDPNLDYMIADTLCRIPETVQDGYNVLRNMYSAYNLDAESRDLVKVRIDSIAIRRDSYPRPDVLWNSSLYFVKLPNRWVARVSYVLAPPDIVGDLGIIETGTLNQVKAFFRSKYFAENFDKSRVINLGLWIVATRKDKEGIKVLNFLIESGAVVNAQMGYRAFYDIVNEGNVQMLTALLHKGFNLRESKETSDYGLSYGEWGLQNAASRKDYNGLLIVQLLEKEYVNLNAIDKRDGNTALLTAARSGSFFINRFLIEKGANINIGKKGATPLSTAIGRKDKDGMLIVKFFLKNGANLKGIEGAEALGVAAMSENIEGIVALIDAGVDINTVDARGRTALMVASEYGVINSVRVLLKRGAKTEIKDSNGETAYQIAEEHYFYDIAKMIKQNQLP